MIVYYYSYILYNTILFPIPYSNRKPYIADIPYRNPSRKPYRKP